MDKIFHFLERLPEISLAHLSVILAILSVFTVYSIATL